VSLLTACAIIAAIIVFFVAGISFLAGAWAQRELDRHRANRPPPGLGRVRRGDRVLSSQEILDLYRDQ
jgi:hypothetical protein